LAPQQVRVKRQAVHAETHHLRRLALQHLRFERQILLLANRGIIADYDPLGRDQLHQTAGDVRQTPVHGLVQGLQHQVAAVAVHHKARQPVRLAVNEPVGLAVVHQT